MNVAIIAITDKAIEAARVIQNFFPQYDLVSAENGVKKAFEAVWDTYEGIICVMASGIVVRCLSGLLQNKYCDPCVVIVDENRRFAVSLLSGHIGGGNELVRSLAATCVSEAVITTASDISGHTAIDLWSIEYNLSIANSDALAKTSSNLLNKGYLSVYQEDSYVPVLPHDFKNVAEKESADIIIGSEPDETTGVLYLIPRIVYIGFGCRAGVGVEEFAVAVEDLCQEYALDIRAVAGAASIDIKREERGLVEFARKMGWPIRFFSKDLINSVVGIRKSTRVYEKIGVFGVSEPAAILAASYRNKPGRLIIEKKKWKRITAAVAIRENYGWSEPDPDR